MWPAATLVIASGFFFIKQQPESEQSLLNMATKKVKIKCIFPVEHGKKKKQTSVELNVISVREGA